MRPWLYKFDQIRDITEEDIQSVLLIAIFRGVGVDLEVEYPWKSFFSWIHSQLRAHRDQVGEFEYY